MRNVLYDGRDIVWRNSRDALMRCARIDGRGRGGLQVPWLWDSSRLFVFHYSVKTTLGGDEGKGFIPYRYWWHTAAVCVRLMAGDPVKLDRC